MTLKATDGKQKPEELFGAVPLNAILDSRLSKNDRQVLEFVAHFHRFGRNKIGCTPKHSKLAKALGLHKSEFSRSISRLREWGYISSIRNPKDRRRLILFVRYPTKGNFEINWE